MNAPTLHVGFGGKYVSIYSKPISEAKESDRVCRFPRTPETERLALAMVASVEMLEVLETLVASYINEDDLAHAQKWDRDPQLGTAYHGTGDLNAQWLAARAAVVKAKGQ